MSKTSVNFAILYSQLYILVLLIIMYRDTNLDVRNVSFKTINYMTQQKYCLEHKKIENLSKLDIICCNVSVCFVM